MPPDRPEDAGKPLPTGPSLEDGVASLPGIGPGRAALLARLGIVTVRDLLLHFPRAYRDCRELTPLASVEPGERVSVVAEITSSRQVRLRGRQSLALITLADGTGTLQASFFGRGFLARSAFVPGRHAFFTGRVGQYNGPCLSSPEYELLEEEDLQSLRQGRILPAYPLTEGITQRMLRKWVLAALDAVAPGLAEPLPGELAERMGFPPAAEALRGVHAPDSPEAAAAARRRLIFEELLVLQTDIQRQKRLLRQENRAHTHRVGGELLRRFQAEIPFALTAAQRRAVEDILGDMAGPTPMLRLLQGDVGSGKTLVALHAAVVAADGGLQTAFMAPTELLAAQHALVLEGLLAPLGLRTVLLTGAAEGRGEAHRAAASGDAQVVVGTHALFQDRAAFHQLGLVIIDEQHRFGVAQRELLVRKGPRPDVLQMSATPIPRSLALTVFGRMDLTVMDELPPGRTPVTTRYIPQGKTAACYDHVRKQAEEGVQAYVVCPLIEDSIAKQDTRALLTHFSELSAGPLAGLRTGLLHGRLPAPEKDAVMRAFKRGEIQVLFSTTVIEVGIDVPNATLMVIENASEFGLTQLHQLRGRVGRGTRPSFCFLLGKPRTPEGRERLETLCKCSSGFDIAEADLRMRGPGELLGVRQAGLSDLRAADLIRDARLLDAARREAERLTAPDCADAGNLADSLFRPQSDAPAPA